MIPTNGSPPNCTVPRWNGERVNPDHIARVVSSSWRLSHRGRGLLTWSAVVQQGMLIFLTRTPDHVQAGDYVITVADPNNGTSSVAQVVDSANGALTTMRVSLNTLNYTFLTTDANEMWLSVDENTISVGATGTVGQFTITSARLSAPTHCKYVSFGSVSHMYHIQNIQSWAPSQGVTWGQ